MQTAFVRFTSNDPIQSDVQVRKNADAASKKKGANPIVYDATMNAGFGANARSNRVAASIHRHFKPNAIFADMEHLLRDVVITTTRPVTARTVPSRSFSLFKRFSALTSARNAAS